MLDFGVERVLLTCIAFDFGLRLLVGGGWCDLCLLGLLGFLGLMWVDLCFCYFWVLGVRCFDVVLGFGCVCWLIVDLVVSDSRCICGF